MPKNLQRRGSAHDFVRGGQTTIHTFRMLKQVVKVLFWGSIIVASLYSFFATWSETTAYQRYVVYKYYVASVWKWIDPEPTAKLKFTSPENKEITVFINDLLINEGILEYVNFVEQIALNNLKIGGILGGICGVLITALFIFNGTRLAGKEHKRGGQLVSAKILKKQIETYNKKFIKRIFGFNRKSKKNSEYIPYEIAGIPFPYRSETTHLFINGSTGTGKTVTINDLVEQIVFKKDCAVIFDPLGSYTELFYDPDKHFILNPYDIRTAGWDMFNDIESESDINMIAEALIPSKKNEDDVWVSSSRVVFKSACIKLMHINKATINNLLELLLRTHITDLVEFLQGTDAMSIIDPKAPKQTAGVRMNLSTYLEPLRKIVEVDNSFSISSWVKSNADSKILFLTSRADMQQSLKPLHTLWFNLAIKKLLSGERTDDKNFWFILDEVAALHKIPSITEGMQEGRQFGLSFVLGIQVYSQLEQIYGREGAQTISGLCRSKMILGTSDYKTAEWLANNLGKEEAFDPTESVSFGESKVRDGVNIQTKQSLEHLVLPTQILKLPNLEGFISFVGAFPIAKINLEYVEYPKINERFIPIKQAFDPSEYLSNNTFKVTNTPNNIEDIGDPEQSVDENIQAQNEQVETGNREFEFDKKDDDNHLRKIKEAEKERRKETVLEEDKVFAGAERFLENDGFETSTDAEMGE